MTTTINIDARVLQFNDLLKSLVERSWAKTAIHDHLTELMKGALEIDDEVAKIGEMALDVWTDLDADQKERFSAGLICYSWAEKVKSFLILWRNVFFEQQKAQVLLADTEITEETVLKLKQASQVAIANASQDLIQYFDDEYERIRRDKKGIQGQLTAWSVQDNPWGIYRNQNGIIAEQCEILWQEYKALINIISVFDNIEQLVVDTVEECVSGIKSTKEKAGQAIRFIEDNIKPDQEAKPGKIAAKFQEMEQEVPHIAYLEVFNEKVDAITIDLPEKMRVPVQANAGMLQYKDVFFKKRVQQWLESEVLPILYEVWELTENVSNGIKISLINIYNRATLLASENKDGKSLVLGLQASDFSLPLIGFLNKSDNVLINIEDLEGQLRERLADTFSVAQVYNPTEEFLPIPLQSTINQLKINDMRFIEVFAQTYKYMY